MLRWYTQALRVLLGTLLLSGIASAQARDADAAGARSAYAISPQPLASALIAFSQQSGVQVLSAGLPLQAARSEAVVGEFTAPEALARLLSGSSFTGVFTNAQTVVVERLTERERPSRPARSGTRGPRVAEAERLAEITVLGSMLPRSQIETSNGLIVMTAEEIRARGYSSVADALQDATFNTGAILNQSTHYLSSGIWGTKIVGMFGLSPSYTKFLIDGRPLPKYPRPTTGTNSLYVYVPVTNLTGIPLDLVDRIEVLPGGHSSLYGSDAIAGVINVVLRKRADERVLRLRHGEYSGGGGRERALSYSDGFGNDRARVMVGVQIADQDPIWGFQRDPRYWDYVNASDYLPEQGVPIARRYVDGDLDIPDASSCGALAGLWGGSVRYFDDRFGGGYCGSRTVPSFGVLTDRVETASVSTRATFDVNENFYLYADYFGSDESQARPSFDQDGFFARFFDPSLGKTVVIWRDFAPEEVAGSLHQSLTTTNHEKTYLAAIGGRGRTVSGWTYDISMSRSAKRVVSRTDKLLRNTVAGSYASYLLGPPLGTAAGGLPIHAPDYTRLYSVVTPEQFRSFVGTGLSRGQSSIDLARLQLTRDELFSLAGGKAGLAVVLESGAEYWSYGPDRNVRLGGSAFRGTVNSGHTDQLAAGAELRLPLLEPLSVELSARYDRNNAEGMVLDDVTYSFATEYRPVETLLFRGKFGTAFKAPSLPDRFTAARGVMGDVEIFDYLRCSQAGYGGTVSEISASCPVALGLDTATLVETFNPDLDSTKARSLSYGIVWSPSARLALRLDYQQVAIDNEVQVENTIYLLQMEYLCSTGSYDSRSAQCQSVRENVYRNPAPPGSSGPGSVSLIQESRTNLAREWNRSVRFGINYAFDLGRYGELGVDADYTVVRKHELQPFPHQEREDLRRSPGYNSDFGNKANLSIAWSRNRWNLMVLCRHYGSTPNALAQQQFTYDDSGAGKLPSWRIYNAGISYSLDENVSFSLRTNNLRNAMPPAEPYSSFNRRNYNPFGREILFEATYRFDRR